MEIGTQVTCLKTCLKEIKVSQHLHTFVNVQAVSPVDITGEQEIGTIFM